MDVLSYYKYRHGAAGGALPFKESPSHAGLREGARWEPLALVFNYFSTLLYTILSRSRGYYYGTLFRHSHIFVTKQRVLLRYLVSTLLTRFWYEAEGITPVPCFDTFHTFFVTKQRVLLQYLVSTLFTRFLLRSRGY